MAASAHGRAAGVVHGDVEAAVVLGHRGDEAVHRLGVAHVGGRRTRRPPAGSSSGWLRPQTATRAPAASERVGDAPADAPGAAGDEGDPAVEIGCDASSSGERRANRPARRCEPRPVRPAEVVSSTVRRACPSRPSVDDHGIAEVVMDNPPVNALTVAGWFELADIVARRWATTPRCGSWCCGPRAGASTPASTSRRCRPPRASTPSIGANRGCYAAFAAVYECAVPVIAAVNGFCLGGGIGLVGNADVIVAADDATFGLPEVDRGALGAATHLARLVPQHKMRAMVYTSATATAARAARTSARCCEVVPAGRAARRRPARSPRQIAAKSPDGDPGGQGVAQRHRPVGREAQLPLRAGLHLRAQPVRRGRRAPRRLRRQARHADTSGEDRPMARTSA